MVFVAIKGSRRATLASAPYKIDDRRPDLFVKPAPSAQRPFGTTFTRVGLHMKMTGATWVLDANPAASADVDAFRRWVFDGRGAPATDDTILHRWSVERPTDTWGALAEYVGVGGAQLTEDLIRMMRQEIRNQASPQNVPDTVMAVSAISHTRSGKKLEILLKPLMRGAVIVDASSLTAFADLVAARLGRAVR